jgi:hypothetical protein
VLCKEFDRCNLVELRGMGIKKEKDEGGVREEKGL